MRHVPTIAAIQEATAREFQVPVAWMREPHGKGARNLDKARPRQAAMALSVLLSERTYERVGHFFGGRDHTTVMCACRRVAESRRSDPALHEKLRRITREVLG